MGLTKQGPESGGSTEMESPAMYHTYEVSLVNPGKRLVGIWKKDYSLHESEGMMRKTRGQLPGVQTVY